MPRGRKTANPENETKKKTTRRKKAVEPATESPVEAAAETASNAPVEAAKSTAAAAPAPKKRGRKPKAAAETAADAVTADAPVKKTRGRKKAALKIVAEPAPPVDAETAILEEPVDIQPDMVVDVTESVVEESAAEELLSDQFAVDAAPSAPVAEAPAKKPRKPRTKKADPAPKRRGRPPKSKTPELVLTTTLQIGDTEFDISGIAEKAYKEYKRVHKRKVVTDFRIYVKPEEGAAYYTVNGEGSEDFKVDLT